MEHLWWIDFVEKLVLGRWSLSFWGLFSGINSLAVESVDSKQYNTVAYQDMLPMLLLFASTLQKGLLQDEACG